MIEMLMSLALAFGITFYALPSIIHLSEEKRLFDFPDDRKVHKQPIPSLGGLAIFAGFITAFLLTVTFTGDYFVFQYTVAAMLVMFFVGIKDDLLNIAAFKKFLGQLLAASILVFKGGLVIDNMHGVLGIYELPPMVANAFSTITIVVIINAFNLIDGIDGLAGTLGVLSMGLFTVFFAVNGDYAYASIGTSMIGALGAFLIFNYPPARIFMGDTGSLLLGVTNAALVVKFIQFAPTAPVWSVAASPAVGFAILFVPLFDTLRVFSFRILNGISPFTPDRNHLHHILLRLGMGHLSVTLSLVGFNALMFAVALFIQPLGNNLMLGIMISFSFMAVGSMLYFYHRQRRRMLASGMGGVVLKKGKIRIISPAAKKAAN
jgi:UDP-N-acetylmuramyl pentapeptide phosphotransferase/UDP-N-acetylglucosamine-1-phosphate transferase